LVGAALVARVPPRFRAEAVIKVIDARPPTDYVQPSFATPAISDVVGERMKALRLHILNRPLLERVAQESGLVSLSDPERARKIEDLRQRFDFRVEGADSFTVAYADTDRARAEYLVNRLAQLFMDQENQEIEARAQGTTKLLASEVDHLRADL